MGPPKRGRLFWDRWLQEYYADRVPVTVKVERIVCWPNLMCEGAPTVVGAPRPAAPPSVAGSSGQRARARASTPSGRRGGCRGRSTSCSASSDADGFPFVVPVEVTGAGRRESSSMPPRDCCPRAPGARACSATPTARSWSGWQLASTPAGWRSPSTAGVHALYSPHTEQGFRAPANKTLLLLANGLLAKQGLRRARREGKFQSAGAS